MSPARLENSAIPLPAPLAAPVRSFRRVSTSCNTSTLSPNSSTERGASPPFHNAPPPPAEFRDSPPPPAPEWPCFATNARAPAPAGSPSAATPLRATSSSLRIGRCGPNRWFPAQVQRQQQIYRSDSQSQPALATGTNLSQRRRQ